MKGRRTWGSDRELSAGAEREPECERWRWNLLREGSEGARRGEDTVCLFGSGFSWYELEEDEVSAKEFDKVGRSGEDINTDRLIGSI